MRRPPSITQWAENALRERIARGLLAPGTRINEAALAQELGISRGPLRESLRRLETEGLVEYVPHRGCVVRSYSRDSLWEVATLRSLLERYAADLALTRARSQLLAELRRQLGVMEAGARQGDWKAVIQGDFAFHEAMMRAAGHHLLLRHWLIIAEPIFQFISLQPQSSLDLRALAEGHAPLLDALESGRHVQEAVDRHIMDALDHILRRLPQPTPSS
ncbi:MAG: GntR family transcriptional regulator [Firmicutes bacterium]|nr:GntR family transcriptional regulator [Bacillota bacterium]